MTIEVDTSDKRFQVFSERLSRRLKLFFGRTVDDALVKDMQAAIDRARSAAILRGLPLPKLVPFVLPKLGVVEVFRADAEPAAINATMGFMMQRYGASLDDLMWGLRRAYPAHGVRLQ